MGLNVNGSGLPEPYAVNSVGNGQHGLVDGRPLSFGALPDSFQKTLQSGATKENVLVRIKNAFSNPFISLKDSIGLSNSKNVLPPSSSNSGWGQAAFWGVGTVLLGGLAIGIFHGKIPVKSWMSSLQDRLKTLGSKSTQSPPDLKTKGGTTPQGATADSIRVTEEETRLAAEEQARLERERLATEAAARAAAEKQARLSHLTPEQEAEDVATGVHTLNITPFEEHSVNIELRPTANKSAFIEGQPILQGVPQAVPVGGIIQIGNRLYKVTPEKTLHKVSDDAALVQRFLSMFSQLEHATSAERKSKVKELLDNNVVAQWVKSWDDIEKLRPVMNDIDSNEKSRLFNQLLNNKVLFSEADAFSFDPDKKMLMFLYDSVGAVQFQLNAHYDHVIENLNIPAEIRNAFDHTPAKAATATLGTNYIPLFNANDMAHRVFPDLENESYYYIENDNRVDILNPDFIYYVRDPDVPDTAEPAELERWVRKPDP